MGGVAPAPDPAEGRHHGWRNWFRLAVFPRFGSEVIGHSLQTTSHLATYRVATEAALAARCQGVLDGRTRAIRRAIAEGGSHLTWTWFVGSGWQERSADLYAAVAEVAGKLRAR